MPRLRRDLGGLGLGGVPAAGVQLGVGPLVAAHRPLADRRVVAAHLGLGLAQAAYDVVEAARGQDPVAGEHLGVAGARVLRQVADRRRSRAPARRRAAPSPARILVRVVLPAPLRPTRPTLSPAATRKLTSSIRSRAPARTSSCWAVIIRLVSRMAPVEPAATQPMAPVDDREPRESDHALQPEGPARHRAGPRRRRRGGGGGGRRRDADPDPRRHQGRRRHRRHPDHRSCSSCSPSAWAAAPAASRCPTPASTPSRMPGTDTGRYANCKTGADANDERRLRPVAVENSLVRLLGRRRCPSRPTREFQPARRMQTFTGGVEHRLRRGDRRGRPVLLPGRRRRSTSTPRSSSDVLEEQLGGPGGDFVEPYVLAHEYGHHIQNLLGTMGQVRTQQGPNSDAVRLELQADCYAGMWAKNATAHRRRRRRAADPRPHRGGHPAGASTRPRPSATTGSSSRPAGRVDQEQWTHGSAEQRMKWFMTGYERGHARGLRHLRRRASSDRVRLRSARAAPRSAATCRCSARRYGATLGVAELPGQRALAAGDPGQRPLGRG